MSCLKLNTDLLKQLQVQYSDFYDHRCAAMNSLILMFPLFSWICCRYNLRKFRSLFSQSCCFIYKNLEVWKLHKSFYFLVWWKFKSGSSKIDYSSLGHHVSGVHKYLISTNFEKIWIQSNKVFFKNQSEHNSDRIACSGTRGKNLHYTYVTRGPS